MGGWVQLGCKARISRHERDAGRCIQECSSGAGGWVSGLSKWVGGACSRHQH
jgi:hypothetical protein